LPLGPFQTNAYLLTCPQTKESVLIDAPAEAMTILERLGGTDLKLILMTHSHFDHVQALAEVLGALKTTLAAHAADSAGLPVQPDVLLSDGQTINFGRVRLKTLHTPGHTAGSLCFLSCGHLFSGDAIFAGGPGKTSSPEAFSRIVESIGKKILPLADKTQIHPGHGDSTSLERERAAVEAFLSRPMPLGLCGDVVWTAA